MLSSTLAAAAACLGVAYLAVRAALAVVRFRRYELAIPGPPTLPLLGNSLSVCFKKHDEIFKAFHTLWAQRRDLSRISFFHNLLVIVSKPEDFAAVMKRKDLQDKSHIYYDILDEVLPAGLLTLKNGAKYKAHRAAVLTAFHPELIASFQEVQTAEAEKFVASLPPREEVVVEEGIFLVMARSFCRAVVMSDEPTKEQEASLNQCIRTLGLTLPVLNERALNPALWPRWIWGMTARGRIANKGIDEGRLFFQQLIAEREVHLTKVENSERGDFVKTRKSLLDVLVLKHKADPTVYSPEEVLVELLTFFAAAVETSASALSFALKMLSMQPDLQQKMYEEVSGVLGSGTGRRSVTAQDLPRLQYSERFLKETMRLFAPIPMHARQVHADTEFGGHALPAGATLALNVFGLHRDPVTWPDPLRFDPDRFTAERSEGRHPYAYMPFSAGLRSCPGSKYAWAVMKTVLVTIVRDFTVEPADDGLDDHAKFKLAFHVSLKMIGGIRVRFTPRAK